jgi:sugar transferase (PEP-CTERM/EpsH1 system associated)
VRILIITNEIPYPPISGVTLRNYHLLRRVAEHHQVYLAAHLYNPGESDGIAHLEEFCERVVTGALSPRPMAPHIPGLFRYALTGKPLELEYFESQELAQAIRSLASEVDFDIVHIEESLLALYLRLFPAGRCKRLLTFHNVCFAQAKRLSKFASTRKMKWSLRVFSGQMRWWEPRYAARFDRCIAVSEADRRLLLAANPRLRVDVVPNGVDTKTYQPLPMNGRSPALLFVGHMGYEPNVDAALFLTQEILPHIRRAVPDVELWLVGRNPSPAVNRLQRDGVYVSGTVSDLLPYYGRSAVCVVPLRAGGGTRLKILEAMALNRPVVSTTIGSEGIDAVDGEHLLNADGAEAFARQVVRTMQDRELSERLAANARQLVVSRYDWDTIASRQLQIYDEVTR